MKDGTVNPVNHRREYEKWKRAQFRETCPKRKEMYRNWALSSLHSLLFHHTMAKKEIELEELYQRIMAAE